MANHIFPRATCLASSFSVRLLLVHENTIATQLNLDSQKIQPLHLYFIVSYIVY